MSDKSVYCKCDTPQECILRVSNTPSNPGRQFYACPQKNGCGFFLWAKKPPSKKSLATSTRTSKQISSTSADIDVQIHQELVHIKRLIEKVISNAEAERNTKKRKINYGTGIEAEQSMEEDEIEDFELSNSQE